MTDKTTLIYTDGSCLGNPGPGGWGYIITTNGEITHRASGGEKATTNNRMELMGAINGVEAGFELNMPSFEIISDSSYVIRGSSEWIHGWRRKQFVGVKNPDLWQKLNDLMIKAKSDGILLTWSWVRGHNGHPMNEAVDKLAHGAATRIQDGSN